MVNLTKSNYVFGEMNPTTNFAMCPILGQMYGMSMYLTSVPQKYHRGTGSNLSIDTAKLQKICIHALIVATLRSCVHILLNTYSDINDIMSTFIVSINTVPQI